MSVNQIYFAQHGLAIDKAENIDRPLSPEGINQTQNVAKTLKKLATPISQVFHSGKLRAQQTAEIFATILELPSPKFHSNMSPNDDCNILINDLNINYALYIGHLPHLDNVISSLVTQHTSDKILQFKNSAIVCLNKNNDRYSISLYLTPNLIDTIVT